MNLFESQSKVKEVFVLLITVSENIKTRVWFNFTAKHTKNGTTIDF
jgi:hypothetical protein